MTVQEAMRPHRLVVTGMLAGSRLDPDSYHILDILCGTRSQLGALGAVSGAMFTSDTTLQYAGFLWGDVQPGTSFTVRIADAPAGSVFSASMSGEAIH